MCRPCVGCVYLGRVREREEVRGQRKYRALGSVLGNGRSVWNRDLAEMCARSAGEEEYRGGTGIYKDNIRG